MRPGFIHTSTHGYRNKAIHLLFLTELPFYLASSFKWYEHVRIHIYIFPHADTIDLVMITTW